MRPEGKRHYSTVRTVCRPSPTDPTSKSRQIPSRSRTTTPFKPNESRGTGRVNSHGDWRCLCVGPGRSTVVTTRPVWDRDLPGSPTFRDLSFREDETLIRSCWSRDEGQYGCSDSGVGDKTPGSQADTGESRGTSRPSEGRTSRSK